MVLMRFQDFWAVIFELDCHINDKYVGEAVNVSMSQCNQNKKLINCWISALNAKVSAIAGKELQCKTRWRPVKTYQLLLSLSQNSKSPAKTSSIRKKTSHWSLIHAFKATNQPTKPIAKVWYSPHLLQCQRHPKMWIWVQALGIERISC